MEMMDRIKRIAGTIWLALAPAAMYLLITTALQEVERKPVVDTMVQWGVFVVVFIPIAIGMMLFGYFALKGEYDRLPERSEDL